MHPNCGNAELKYAGKYRFWFSAAHLVLYLCATFRGRLHARNIVKIASLQHFQLNFVVNLFLLLPQALTKDKPLTILIHECIFHNMFRLAP